MSKPILAMLATALLSIGGCGDEHKNRPVPKPAYVAHYPTWFIGNYWVFRNLGETTAINVYVVCTECGTTTEGFTTPRDIPPGEYGLFPDPDPNCVGADNHADITWE
jgi:hypothetical protein